MIYKFQNSGTMPQVDATRVAIPPREYKRTTIQQDHDALVKWNLEHPNDKVYRIEDLIQKEKEANPSWVKKIANMEIEVPVTTPAVGWNGTSFYSQVPKVKSTVGKELGYTMGLLTAPALLSEFGTYGLIGGGLRLGAGSAAAAGASYAGGKAGDWLDNKLGSNWIGDTNRLILPFITFPAGMKGANSILRSAAGHGITMRMPQETFSALRNEYFNNTANKVPTTIETVPDSHRIFRAPVYKGGNIKDPYFSFFTTDPEYAKQYGPVSKYILEQKGPVAIAKEPMIGSRDVATNDMFIDRNTKDVPSAKIILGHDLVTPDIPIKSKGLEILSFNKPSSLKPIVSPQEAATTYHFDGRMPLTKPISFEEKLGWTKGERNQPIKQGIKSNPRYFLDSEELFPRDLVEIVSDDALVPNVYKQYMLSHKSDKHRGFDIYGWLEEPPTDREIVINNINDFAKTLPDYDPRFAREDGNPSFYITQFRDYLSSLGYDTSDISDESVLKLLTHQYKELSSGATGKLKGRLVFHGTDKPFESFDYHFTGKNTGNMGYNGAGNYFTTHPSAYGSKMVSTFFGKKYRVGFQQPYMITGIKSTLLNDGNLSPKLNIPDYISPHGGDYKSVIDRAIRMADTGAVKDMAVIDNISHYPIQLFTEEVPISEFSVARNTGIKSLFPHPSRFIRNEDGTVRLIPTDWSDIRVNYKQGGKI